MHRVALLATKNKDLQEANIILSRRRRAKRTRLQKRGVMTVEEGRQAINQMDVDAQVAAKSSRSGGRGRSVGPGVRRYGVCGKPGHNIRTY